MIASDNGRRAEAEGAGYVASKFGAVGLALSLSQELYGSGVGVHVIEPGCVDTEWYGNDEGEVPRDRMLSADDVAYLALFLATLPNAHRARGVAARAAAGSWSTRGERRRTAQGDRP